MARTQTAHRSPARRDLEWIQRQSLKAAKNKRTHARLTLIGIVLMIIGALGLGSYILFGTLPEWSIICFIGGLALIGLVLDSATFMRR